MTDPGHGTARPGPAAAGIARAVLQLRGRWVLLRRRAGTVVVYGVVAIAGGQLCHFNAIESIPIGLAVLLEYLGVVLVVGWLWAVRDQRPDHVRPGRGRQPRGLLPAVGGRR